VSRHACVNLLSRGKSVAIVIGGGSESLLASPGRYDLILMRRRGFVKIALQTGAALVPVVAFGESDLFRTVNELSYASMLRRFQRKLEKLTGFTVPLAYGRGLFMRRGLLPYPTPINVVVGAPLEVERYQGESGRLAAGRSGCTCCACWEPTSWSLDDLAICRPQATPTRQTLRSTWTASTPPTWPPCSACLTNTNTSTPSGRTT
jgi:hypothetical protein